MLKSAGTVIVDHEPSRAMTSCEASYPKSERKQLTILCPCYNEQGVITLFFRRLLPVITELSSRYSVVVTFLNNASTDGTLQEVLALRNTWPETYVITMSRNVGYQRSLECGLRNSTGDFFIFVDTDCEDPPEMILQFISRYEEGYDIVYGERVDREEPEYLIAGRKFFYRLLKSVADEEIILDMAEFALFSAEVRDAIMQDSSSFPFIRASIGRVGFRRFGIPFKRELRIGGQTHYNIFGMTVFALAGILSASTLLLRIPIYLLPAWTITLAVLGTAFAVTGSRWLAVFAALTFAIYVGSTIAFIALYVARNYKNTLHRPNAFIDRKRSFMQTQSNPLPTRLAK
jgi:glycosyltransferase involved in cell wall biosynthesis